MRERDHLRRVTVILIRSEAEEPTAAVVLLMLFGEQIGEISLALQRSDFVQHRIEWRGTERFDARLVHAGFEVVADFLLGRSAIGRGLCCLL